MQLSPGQLTLAVSLAINDHIPLAQTRVGELSDWKGLSVAEAGRNAVFAARLARARLTGPAPIFEGSSGFFQQVTGSASVDVDAFGGHDVPFRIHKYVFKPYPSLIYTQTAFVAGIEVAREVAALDRIAAIEIAQQQAGVVNEPEASLRSGRPTPERPPTTAFPTSPHGRCSTATSPMRVFPSEKFRDPESRLHAVLKASRRPCAHGARRRSPLPTRGDCNPRRRSAHFPRGGTMHQASLSAHMNG